MISSTRTLTVALGLALVVNALLATAASGADIRTIQLATNDLIYDPGTGRIYASVPGRAPGGIGNSIVAIDPETGTIGPPVFVGSEPGRLARSDDGRFLYVGLDGAGAVRRFDLGTQTPGLQFPLGSDQFFGARIAHDIQVLPGSPHAVAVAMGYRTVYPQFAGVAIFDNGVARPTVIPDFASSRGQEVNRLIFSDSAAHPYGHSTEVIPTMFYTNVLGREASATEIRSWVGYLTGNPSVPGVTAMAHTFLDGPEFLGRAGTQASFVTLLYDLFLGRTPGASERDGWVGALQAGFDSALPGFVASPDFSSLLPDPRNPAAVEAVVARLYVHVLGRSPAPAEAAAWTG